jgi:type IV pilus assembly protein PilE
MTTGSRAPRAAGFTLVELMVTVAIVAVIAAIAYPGYRAHVVKTQRGDAQACLEQYSAQMERRADQRLRGARHAVRHAVDESPGPEGRKPGRPGRLLALSRLRAAPAAAGRSG